MTTTNRGLANDDGTARDRLVQLLLDGDPLSSEHEVESTVDAILAAGWRPPLPEPMCEPFAPDDESPAALVAAYLAHFLGARPARMAAHIARGLDALGLLKSSPRPDSETEWGWKPDPDEPDQVICATDEQAARERVSKASYRKLARREVGPWVEVSE